MYDTALNTQSMSGKCLALLVGRKLRTLAPPGGSLAPGREGQKSTVIRATFFTFVPSQITFSKNNREL